MAHTHSGSPVMLEDQLQAGFLRIQTERGGVTKELAGFEVLEGSPHASYRRPCTASEKKRLKKLIYGEQVIKSVRCALPGVDDEADLFVTR